MLTNPLFYAVAASVLLVLGILILGLLGFMRGGEFNRKYANKIMRARIAAQFLAVLLVLAFVYFSRQGG